MIDRSVRTTALTLALLSGTVLAAAAPVKQYAAKVQAFDGSSLSVQWLTGPNKGQTTSVTVGGTPVYSGKGQVAASALQNAVHVNVFVDASGSPAKIQITAAKPAASAGKGSTGPAPGDPRHGERGPKDECAPGYQRAQYLGSALYGCFTLLSFECIAPNGEFVSKPGTRLCGHPGCDKQQQGASRDQQGKAYCLSQDCKPGEIAAKSASDGKFHCAKSASNAKPLLTKDRRGVE